MSEEGQLVGTGTTINEIASILNVDTTDLSHINGEVLKALIKFFHTIKDVKRENLELNDAIDTIKTRSSAQIATLRGEIDRLTNKDILLINEDIHEHSKQNDDDASELIHMEQLKKQVGELEKTCSTLNNENTKLQGTIEKLVAEVQLKEEDNENLRSEKRELASNLFQVESRLKDSSMNSTNMQLELSRKSKEIEVIEKHRSFLEKELEARTRDLMALRSERQQRVKDEDGTVSRLDEENRLLRTDNELLRERNIQLISDLTEKATSVKEVTNNLIATRNSFSREMGLKNLMTSLLEKQIKSLQEGLEGDFGGSFERNKLLTDLASTKSTLAAAQKEILRLQTLLNEYTHTIELTASDTPDQDVENTSHSGSDEKQKRHISELRKYAVKEKQQKFYLQNELNSIVRELNEKLPELKLFKERAAALEDRLASSTDLLDQLYREKEEIKTEFESFKNKHNESKENLQELRVQRADLAQQVQYLLLVLSHQYSAHDLLSNKDLLFIRRLVRDDSTDSWNESQKVISEWMVKFESVAELQKRNMELLRATRYLSGQLELNGNMADVKNGDNSFTPKNIHNGTEERLKERIDSLEERVRLLSHERDSYKLLLHLDSDEDTKETNPLLEKEALINKLREELSNSKQMSQLEIEKVSKVAEEQQKELRQLHTNICNLEASVKHSESRVKMLEDRSSSLLSEREKYKQQASQFREALEEKSTEMSDLSHQLLKTKTDLQTLEVKCDELERAKSLIDQENWKIKRRLSVVSEERDNLKIGEKLLQNKVNDLNRDTARNEEQLSKKIQSYEARINELNNTVISKEQEMQKREEEYSKEVAWFQNKVDEQARILESLDDTNKYEPLNTKPTKLELTEIGRDHTTSLEQSHITNLDDFIRLQQDLNNLKLEVENYKTMLEKSEDTSRELCKNFGNVESELQKQIETLLKENLELKKSLEQIGEDSRATKRSLEEKNQALGEANKMLMEKVSKLSVVNKEVGSVDLDLKAKIEKLTSELAQERSEREKLESALKNEGIESNNLTDSLRKENEWYKAKVSELSSKISDLNSFKRDHDGLEEDLREARSQLEDLSAQNNLLFERLGALDENMGEGSTLVNTKNDLNGDLLTSLKRERDGLQMRLSSMKRELNRVNMNYSAAKNELEKYVSSKRQKQGHDVDYSHILSEYGKLREEVGNVNTLKQSLETSRAEITNLKKQNQNLQSLLDEQNKELIPLKTKNEALENSSQEKDRIISVYQNDNSHWKEELADISHQLQTVTEEKNKLGTQLSSLNSKMEEKIRENAELEDKFTRLKKQAHERLDESKAHSLELSMELEKVKKEAESLKKVLEERSIKMVNQESHQDGDKNEEKTVRELNSELNIALERLKDAEKKLAENVASFKAESQRSSLEIDSLKSELAALRAEKDSKGDLPSYYTEKLNELQNKFEKEKAVFVEQKTKELNELYGAKNKSKDVTPGTITSDELEALKKTWEEETLRRIEDAKENLKKHIRLPTEEKIKRVIDKRKADLESKFDQRVEERANLLALSKETQSPPEVLREEIRKQVELSLRQEFDESRKKAFEEGRQQSAMKIKLLEKRLAQNDKANKKQLRPIDKPISLGSSDASKSKFGLSKIDVDSPRVMLQPKDLTNYAADTKVRKLNSSIAPNSGQEALRNTNPFTAQLGNKFQALGRGATQSGTQAPSSFTGFAPSSAGFNSVFAATPFNKTDVDLASPFRPTGFNFRLPQALSKPNEPCAQHSSAFKRLTPTNPGDEEQRDSKKAKAQPNPDQ